MKSAIRNLIKFFLDKLYIENSTVVYKTHTAKTYMPHPLDLHLHNLTPTSFPILLKLCFFLILSSEVDNGVGHFHWGAENEAGTLKQVSHHDVQFFEKLHPSLQYST